MKNLFIILILIPLFISIKFPFPTDWEWNWNIEWDIQEFLDKFKNVIPEFLAKMKEDLATFIKQNEQKQREKIEQLKEKALEAYNNIKDSADKQYKTFIEKATETAKYVSYKVCNSTNMTSYEECREHKKEVFSQIIEMVHNEFQCSKIVSIITEQIIKGDVKESLKYILFLVNTITNNPDAIAKGKAQAVYDIVYCLKEKIIDNWPEIEKKLKEKDINVQFNKDITSLVLQSMENLVSVIHFEEMDGYIEQSDAKTFLIKNENAKKIHNKIFETLQKLNNYSSQFYNLSTNLVVNVTHRPENKQLDINQEIVSNFPEKGIRIVYRADYFFKQYADVNSIQAVVFDSPLVSIRGKKETEGGTANTFVGITLYDKQGNEVVKTDLNINDLKPIIYYKKKLFKAMEHCLYYNVEDDKIENSGIDTQTFKINGEEYIKCIPNHLTAFTIGSYKSASISNSSNVGTIILIIVLCLIVIGLVVGGYLFWKKRSSVNNSQFDQAFPNKDGLVS